VVNYRNADRVEDKKKARNVLGGGYLGGWSKRGEDLPETLSSLIREGHGTVQAVLTSEHTMSMKNLRSHT